MAEDEMVGWHHRLNGHECEQAPGDGEGQKSLTCCSPWGRKESGTTERLNNDHIETQGLVEVNSSTILDPLGASQFLPCPQAMPFFQGLCRVCSPPVSVPPGMDTGLGWRRGPKASPLQILTPGSGMVRQSPADIRLL
ncbi:unnamed protein product [Rangifer tarandus platyrhynchus]|uniref:Uncharacterized protein n=2 Tax=Rangifer tarandus platyrhynchus TaxID=3082113 RepID=A0AC59ZAP5_RANTA|nr:unnamed protein product [Rangifer tarandus platyrhynchus]